jgi:hypothetical protein
MKNTTILEPDRPILEHDRHRGWKICAIYDANGFWKYAIKNRFITSKPIYTWASEALNAAKQFVDREINAI